MPAEETSGEGAAQEDGAAPGSTSDAGPTPGPRGGGIINHMSANKIEAALWLTRMCTVVFTLVFFLPIIGNASYSTYQRALISNAATSALRLHQRLPNFQLSREFFGRLFLEDSAHYLFYSLIFLSSYPVTMVLVPVFLFALLHAQKYTQQLVNAMGPGSLPFVTNLLAKLNTNQINLLRFIACTEIFLMPAMIFMMFTGNASLLIPFIYYRFLTLRYASQRNPYCRQLFYELRIATEHIINKPQCPGFLQKIAYTLISFITRLAPNQPTQPTQG